VRISLLNLLGASGDLKMLSRFAGIVLENCILQKTKRYAANFSGDYGVHALKPWKVGSGLCMGRAFIACPVIGIKPNTPCGQKSSVAKIGLREAAT